MGGITLGYWKEGKRDVGNFISIDSDGDISVGENYESNGALKDRYNW